MAQLPNFLSGAMLVIKIDDSGNGNGSFPLLYATNLSFTQNMATSGVQVIGAMANQGIEPLAYTASGSFTVMSYANSEGTDDNKRLAAASLIVDGAGAEDEVTKSTGVNAVPVVGGVVATANSFLHKAQLMPRNMLLSSTFNIDISTEADSAAIYTIYDCRLVDWSISFAPGQLASERVSFMARGVRVNTVGARDAATEAQKGNDSGLAAAKSV